jgi:hypothetical protein
LPAAKPGGWNTPARTDDWGNARDNVAGDSAADGRDKAGLYNADGSLRVPGNAGDAIADRGAPGGGNDQWTRERLEEAGTWLQRPPYDYEPTSFDKYWVPSESLLAEWVRRNVREMEIAIPGTNMKLKCSISVLQLGGGCGLGSLFPEPPKARPPPEIPVKRTPIPDRQLITHRFQCSSGSMQLLQTETEPCGSVFSFPARDDLPVHLVQIAQLRRTRTEIRGQVRNVLVAQAGGLRRHQRVLAVAAAVRLQRVRQVVAVLATQLGVSIVDRRIAFGTVAVHAALAGCLAFGLGQFLALGRVALGQAGRRTGTVFATGVAGILGRGLGAFLRASHQGEGREQDDG